MLAALAAACVAVDAGAQSRWGPAGCPQLAGVAQAQPVVWEWRTREDTPGHAYLFRAGVQVGAWDGSRYLPIIGGQWGAACDPPIDPPAGAPPREGAVNLFGVDASKLGGVRYEVNGRPVTRADVEGAIIGDQIPDDAKRTRLVVIGSKQARDRVAADLKGDPLRDEVSIWSVPPDHWSLKSEGRTVWKVDGDPVIYAQDSTGKVLHRQDDYKGPADFAAIRKAMKTYDPAKDRDARKVDSDSPRNYSLLVGVVAVLLGALVVFHTKGK